MFEIRKLLLSLIGNNVRRIADTKDSHLVTLFSHFDSEFFLFFLNGEIISVECRVLVLLEHEPDDNWLRIGDMQKNKKSFPICVVITIE